MKRFHINWASFASHLAPWASLSTIEKAQLLEVASQQTIEKDLFVRGNAQRLIDAGLMAPASQGRDLRIAHGGREFFKAMRAMNRFPLDRGSGLHDMHDYTKEHFTAEEASALQHGNKLLSRAAMEESWLTQLFDLDSRWEAGQWEQRHLPEKVTKQYEDGSPYFTDNAVFDATQRLVRAMASRPDPVPLEQLPGLFPDTPRGTLWQAVMAGVRYLMLFPRLDETTLHPVIGVWPRLGYALNRPPAQAPKPTEPTQTFHTPFLVEDMTTVLVLAASQPLRERASNTGLYQKDFERLSQALVALPDWVYNLGDEDAGRDAFDEDDDPPRHGSPNSKAARLAQMRVRDAIAACLTRGLTEIRENRKGKLQQEITSAGREWLNLGAVPRLKTMIDPWRPSSQPNAPRHKRGGKKKAKRRGGKATPWAPTDHMGYGRNVEGVDWVGAWRDTLAGAGSDQFCDMGELLNYHGRVNNPLLGRRARGDYGAKPRLDPFVFGYSPDENLLENAWSQILAEVILTELLPRGAVELGYDQDQVSIRLHAIGRYMLGLDDEVAYQAQPEGDVIVQPNFEIAFMGPAPAAEATLGRLAERTGQRMGAMFRITRESILAAAAAGVKSEDALADLERLSAKPLPDNIRREVAGWFNTVANVQMRRGWFIEAPDPQTANRVLAGAGKQARQLTPTLVEITVKPTAHDALIRKLQKSGVFVQ